MNIKAFRLYNFMAFQDSGWIELNSISLLFGRNSSGKSAVIRALRLLKQSLDSKSGETLVLSSEDGIALGSFDTVLHNHGKVGTQRDIFDPNWLAAQSITFQFRCAFANELLEPLVTRSKATLKVRDNDMGVVDTSERALDFSLQFVYDDRMQGSSATKIQLIGLHIDCDWVELTSAEIHNLLSASRLPDYYDHSDELASLLQGKKLSDVDDEHRKQEERVHQDTTVWSDKWFWESDLDLDKPWLTEERLWDQISVAVHDGVLPQLVDEMGAESSPTGQNLSFPLTNDFEIFSALVDHFASYLRTFLVGIQHLGPLRPEPQREYVFTAETIARWQRRGLGAMVEFFRSAPTDIKPVNSDPNSLPDPQGLPPATLNAQKELENTRNEEIQKVRAGYDIWLQQLDLGRSHRISKVNFPTSEGFVASLYIEDKSGREDNVSDVGSGVGQVLPIIITCLNAKSNELVIIEQPELHLHPKAQAVLADLFIDTHNRGVRLLIETHSEHLLIRARLRISQTSATIIDQINKLLKVSENSIVVVWVYRLYDKSFAQLVLMDYVGNYHAIGEEFQDFFSNDMDDILELNRAARKARKLQENKEQ